MKHLLKARLSILTRCPACLALRHVGVSARFQCGSSFIVSETTGTIIAADPCPALSNHMANMLTMDALGDMAGAA
ncbi:hypothetical protein [Rhizobium sp. FKY42]|uniref:hypothetical protein n=1 Tax=Rhizobium sp. FKY42 TaxID=2562310 RepID=UPI0010C00C1D|nr:hypothetical protein [Rhizobium sp. FKY42]